MTLISTTISVAISTIDRPVALERCLRAIWRGSLRPREIVVVDQSQGDATIDVARRAETDGLPVRLLRQAPRGLGASQNLAVQSCIGSIVAITDDDCLVDARWLECISDAFLRWPSLGALGGRVLPLPPEGDRTWPVSSRVSESSRNFQGNGVPWDVGSGNNFALRREHFLRIGGCDERLGPGSAGLGGVDMDLFYRLLRAGIHLRYEPAALVYHERQTYEQRLARRPLYGHGMGASIAFRWQEGDRRAPLLLARWIKLRLAIMARACVRGNIAEAREEVTMLRSTLHGLRHGATERRGSSGEQH